MEIKKGISASPGICIGKAFVLDSEEYRIPRRNIRTNEISHEVTRFHAAADDSVKELQALVERLSRKVGEASAPIVETHIKMLQDEHIKSQIIDNIRKNNFSPEYSVSRVLRKYAKALYSTNEEFFAERIQDIYDIERRLLKNLLDEKREELAGLKDEVVLIARDLTPTQTVSMDRRKIKGFAIDAGGRTSHTAIIARAMGIPAVVGLNTISLDVSGGDLVIIDGNNGMVIISPDEETLKNYSALEKSFFLFEKKLVQELKGQPACTKDGYEVQVYANIDMPDEIPVALKYGATGIGLFRTEFLYSAFDRLPTEKNHFDVYKQIATQFGSREVIIRTLDLGADKMAINGLGKEKNPFLGCRAIRLCLQNTDMFKTQLRAILHASEFGNLSIMLPMISSLDEIEHAKEIIAQVKTDLRRENIPFKENIKLGIMIEVPSAALVADLLIKHVDFFSIGTNDLIQYAIAVDRVNEKVASLYQPTHPAVLRLIRTVINEGKRHHKPVAMCGEMSGDNLYTILLLGMDLKLFSMAPITIPEIKKIIRSITFSEAKKIAEEAISFQDSRKTTEFLKKHTRRIVSQTF